TVKSKVVLRGERRIRMFGENHPGRWMVAVLALVAIGLAVPNSVSAQSPAAVGNPNIYPKPFPAPALPPAGGSYVDPIFGATIIRVTDPSNAPLGASVNSAAQDSMFNADGSLLYLFLKNSQGNSDAFLFSVDRATGIPRKVGPLPTAQGLGYDGARWDPTNPNVLYAIAIVAT